jgi:hypothetical protein
MPAYSHREYSVPVQLGPSSPARQLSRSVKATDKMHRTPRTFCHHVPRFTSFRVSFPFQVAFCGPYRRVWKDSGEACVEVKEKEMVVSRNPNFISPVWTKHWLRHTQPSPSRFHFQERRARNQNTNATFSFVHSKYTRLRLRRCRRRPLTSTLIPATDMPIAKPTQ